KLNPVNYITYDLLNKTNIFEANYSSKQKEDFINYMHTKTKDLIGEPDVLNHLFMSLYANPVVNKLK
ncbi:MAG: glycerol acyltransferase, partial [Bacteroidia bacterium]|nr:glycerol acyltransferase [Bacteroidia bacterium]